MGDRSKTLLRPADPRWDALAVQKRRLLERPADTVADRLIRGQRLSAQAAALRRGLRHERSAGR